ncbi:Flagellar biosynthetic protein FlhB [uncultured delta proteobacterium]|uniref:Flagellar biosynthetic protein FlhB n=1 Tax=uncultured delta proteobacterium TaxID=34034 RepID=A0A212IU56_9DELT|nr:Flagellar biosynthetic protein FlhB [uncultured delta proteobacterium]
MARDPSRTEDATPRRINKTRSEGNVWKSQEITKTLTVVGGVVGLCIWISYIGNEIGHLIVHFMSTAILTFKAEPGEVINLCMFVAAALAKMILPILLFIGLIVYVVLRVQVGKLWTTKVFTPKLSKFNPINGLKRMLFSLDTFIRMGKSVLQAICIGIAPWMVVKAEMTTFPTLYDTDAAGLIAYILTLGLKMTLWALIPMGALAIFDFAYSRWQYKENLKMTKDEVKDERKQMEGDPFIKGKQRQKMMQMSARRMMQQVPKADVIITNPTHIAIAIRYNSMEAPAPVVIAKGADKIAEKIKEIAREHKIPIRENKPLARALYKQVEIGDMIPEDFFQAVAAILAQIWKTRPRPQGQKIAVPKK